MKYLDDLLLKFVCCNSTSPAVMIPGTIGDFVYATDKHAMIRVSKEKLEKEYLKPDRFPDCTAVIPPITICETVPVEKLREFLSEIKMVPEVIPCPECDGDGTIECNLGHDHDCENCDSNGDIPDPSGKMKYPETPAVAIKNAYFSPRYLALLLECYDFIKPSSFTLMSEGELKAHYFLLDDVMILIMPLAPEEASCTCIGSVMQSLAPQIK